MKRKFEFPPHVQERMLQRDINKATVIDIIENPDYIKTSFDERKIATKKLEKIWHAVFKEEKNKTIVISVYFD